MAKTPAAVPKRPLRTVLSDETYSRIRDMLLNHEIEPGERINIDALARDLDVSQTPIRESLARLESEDLVVKEPLRGYSATELLTVDQMEDLFQFRSLIEPWSARMAARFLTDEGRERLEQELESGRAAGQLDVEGAYAAMSEHDARFHALIAELSGSQFVFDAYVRIHCHLHLFRLYAALKTWSREAREDAEVVGKLFQAYYDSKSGFLAFTEHEGIAQAIAAGDEDLASNRMFDHVANSLERFSPSLSAMAGKRT